jgi:hypothetical protein
MVAKIQYQTARTLLCDQEKTRSRGKPLTEMMLLQHITFADFLPYLFDLLAGKGAEFGT